MKKRHLPQKFIAVVTTIAIMCCFTVPTSVFANDNVMESPSSENESIDNANVGNNGIDESAIAEESNETVETDAEDTTETDAEDAAETDAEDAAETDAEDAAETEIEDTTESEEPESFMTRSTRALSANNNSGILLMGTSTSLTYDANGGTGTMAETPGEVDDTVTVADNEFTYEGYLFTGWNTKADGSGTAYEEGDDFILSDDGNVLYAQWAAVDFGNVYHYVLSGNGDWELVETESDQFIISSKDMVTNLLKIINTRSVSRNPIEAVGSYTLRNKFNGYKITSIKIGSSSNASFAQTSYENIPQISDSTLIPDVSPLKEFFQNKDATVNLWSVIIDLDHDNDIDVVDLRICSRWQNSVTKQLFIYYEPMDEELTYDANGGTGTMTGQGGKYGDTVTVVDNEFTYEGYLFTGWNTKADGSGTAYATGDDFALSDDGNVLYAQWQDDAIGTVYHYVKDESGNWELKLTETDQHIFGSAEATQLQNYAFRHVITDADLLANYYVLENKFDGYKLTTVTLNDLPQYDFYPAPYTDMITVIDRTNPQYVDLKDYFADPNAQASLGRIVLDVMRNHKIQLNDAVACNRYKFSLDKILSIYYEPLTDNLYYDANSGTGTMEATTGNADGTVTVSNNSFTRSGYTFTGWNTEADGSGTAYAPGDGYTLTTDVVDILYAQWRTASTPYYPPAVTRANYTVKWYDTDGKEIKTAETRYGNVGANVSVTDADKAIEGYTFDEENANNVLTDTIASNGSTTLKLYFTANSSEDNPSTDPSDTEVDNPSDSPSDNHSTKPEENPSNKPNDNYNDSSNGNATNDSANGNGEKNVSTVGAVTGNSANSNGGANTNISNNATNGSTSALPQTGDAVDATVLIASLLTASVLLILFTFKLRTYRKEKL